MPPPEAATEAFTPLSCDPPERVEVELQQAEFCCLACGHHFELPTSCDFHHGEHVVRSLKLGELGRLQALDEPAVEEIIDIANTSPLVAKLSVYTRDSLIGKTYLAIAHLAPDGTRFASGRKPDCPKCGDGHVSELRRTYNFQKFSPIRLRYHSWNRMAPAEKVALVEHWLQQFIDEDSGSL